MCQLHGGGAHAYELLYTAVPSSTDGEDEAAVLMAHTALPLPREPVPAKNPRPWLRERVAQKTPGWPVKNTRSKSYPVLLSSILTTLQGLKEGKELARGRGGRGGVEGRGEGGVGRWEQGETGRTRGEQRGAEGNGGGAGEERAIGSRRRRAGQCRGM